MPNVSPTIPLVPVSAVSPVEAAYAPAAPKASHSTRETRPALPRSESRAGAATSPIAQPLQSILTRARFAPSGDNTQPWRFEIISHQHIVIHGRDTRHDCVYDLKGHASLIALGALLETISIAASTHGFRVHFSRRENLPADQPTFDAHFEHSGALTSDPLAAMIEQRVTQRRPMRSRALTTEQIAALTAALPAGYHIQLRQSFSQRFRLAKLLFRSAHIRLTTREAFETHRKVIEWNATFSDDRIPDKAVGVDLLTRKLMRWAMGSWSRITLLNRFLAGTIMPRVQLDFMPALRCAGHFFLIADAAPKSTDDFVAAGRALQRFWLAATQQELLVQPEMTPLIFAQYDKQNLAFSESKKAIARAGEVRKDLDALLTPDIFDRTVFMGRIGAGKQPTSRSLRLPLEKLMSP